MKYRFIPLALSLLLLACGCQPKQPELKTAEDTLSWAMGENMAQSIASFQKSKVNLDEEIIMQAIRHTLDGKEQPISDSAYNQALTFFAYMVQGASGQTSQHPAAVQERQKMAEIKASNPNVKEHPAGFLYEVLKEGSGPNAKYAQRISFDYRSFLMLTGEPYDQTYGKRPPIVHVVGEPMFKGLIEAFQLMNAGSIYRFYFPYELAFGEEGTGPIPGYTPFIYEIELHEIFEK